MGAGQSTSEEEALNGSSKGFHIVKVAPNSPGEAAGLEPYFDFILFVNGHRLDDPEDNTLQEVVRSTVGAGAAEVSLVVYSSKHQGIREVRLTPSAIWTSNPSDGLTGCSVRFCDYEAASEHLWHIISVYPDSPAAAAGLQAGSDYIIGCPTAALHEKEDLWALIEESVGKPLRLYVYSSIMDVVREVLLLPSNAWGGTGSIGCDIGYGYLHKIPLHSSEEEEEEGVEGEGHNHSDHQHPHPHHHQVNPIDTSINSAANTVASASDDVQRKLFDDNVSPDEAVLDSEVLALADPMIEEEEDDDGGSFAIGAVKHELGVDGLTEEETRGDENQHDHYRDQHHRHQHNQQEKSSNKLPLPLTAPPPIDTLQELDQLAHKLESLENVPITSNNKNNHHSLLQQQQQIPLVPDGLFKSPSQPPMNESVFY